MPDRKFLFLCPRPDPWRRIYDTLVKAWRENGSQGEPPPGPLILNGWVFSSDVQKHVRWQETVQWARRRGLSALIPKLTEDEKHSVAAFSRSGWTPPLWSFDSKPKRTREELDAALRELRRRWGEVAGPCAAATEPVKFTGRKGRRLLVRVLAPMNPPWGSGLTFTAFRRAVNDTIKPHEVDHVDFIDPEGAIIC